MASHATRRWQLALSEGRLGTLHGGLVCGSSFRKPMSEEEVQALPLAHVQQQVVHMAKNLSLENCCGFHVSLVSGCTQQRSFVFFRFQES